MIVEDIKSDTLNAITNFQKNTFNTLKEILYSQVTDTFCSFMISN